MRQKWIFFLTLSLFLTRALSPVILKSLFLLPPIRAGHTEWGGGERTGHLHQPANHSGELIRAACSPEAWCCVGTTSDTTSVPSASTRLWERAGVRKRVGAFQNATPWQRVTTLRCPKVMCNRCSKDKGCVRKLFALSHLPWSSNWNKCRE